MKSVVQRICAIWSKNDILAVVFLTGGALLVIEVVAIRILSPYFGNTIYTYSSVITVILAALSGGYWFGGKVADRNLSYGLFYNIIGTSGIVLLILMALSFLILPITAALFSLALGPLISSVVLFGIPSLLLGMLSPYVIALVHHAHKNIQRDEGEVGIGSISGKVFFWSTLGSIAGSLLAGFWLIPNIGIERIMIGIGVLLVMISLYGRIQHRSIAKTSAIMAVIFTLLIASVPLSLMSQQQQADGVVYARDGTYEKIVIRDGTWDGHQARFLVQDMSMSGAMDLDTGGLIFDYTKYYSLYTLFAPHASTILVLGGGAYSIPKAYLHDLPSAHVDVSEIEPRLYELAQQYFNLTPTERLTNYTVDGRKLMAQKPATYDVIYGDVYSSFFSIPPHFMTKEFFETTRASLKDNGVFIANIIGDLSRRDRSFMLSAMHTFMQAFPNSYFFAVDSPYTLHAQNIIFVGYKSDTKIQFDQAKLAAMGDPILAGLPAHRIDPARYVLASTPVFTDNYSPIEAFIAPTITDSRNPPKGFSGREAFNMVRTLLSFGPQYPGASGRSAYQSFLKTELTALADDVQTQDWNYTAHDGTTYQLENIIARINPNVQDRIMLVTHYDTIRDASGGFGTAGSANNGRSPVALLLELLRSWKEHGTPNIGVDVVFFDGEEGEPGLNPNAQTVPWAPLGSMHFVQNLKTLYPTKIPGAAIDLDMIGDKDLGIYREASSQHNAPALNDMVWQTAKSLGVRGFPDSIKYTIYDDHTSLNLAGIPSVLLIDFDYPYYATVRDTLDKCSAESLQSVGDVVNKMVRLYAAHTTASSSSTSSTPPTARAYLVADIDTGKVYKELNARERRPIASITKLMTALVVNDVIASSTTVSIGEGELANKRNTASATVKTFSVQDLLYPLLMQSSNAVADSLAGYVGTSTFVQAMNVRAKELGMASTTFADASGASPNNISTADDLLRLAVYIINNKPFVFDITRIQSKHITAQDGTSTYPIINVNAPADFPPFVGGKVGHTRAASDTMLAILPLKVGTSTHRIAIIVLGSEDQMKDTKYLAEWVTSNIP